MAGQKGRSGRKKTSKAVKTLRGTKRADRENTAVALPPGYPLPPEDLDEESQQEWLRLASALTERGIMTGADWLAWEMGFRVYAMWRRALQELSDISPVEMSEKGGYYQHPMVAIEKQYWERTLKFCKEFGLTPNSRLGLEVATENEGGDPLEGMLSG